MVICCRTAQRALCAALGGTAGMKRRPTHCALASVRQATCALKAPTRLNKPSADPGLYTVLPALSCQSPLAAVTTPPAALRTARVKRKMCVRSAITAPRASSDRVTPVRSVQRMVKLRVKRAHLVASMINPPRIPVRYVHRARVNPSPEPPTACRVRRGTSLPDRWGNVSRACPRW